LRLDADVGEVAQPGTVLFTVGQPRPWKIIAEINEEDIPLIEVGQRALLRTDAFPDQVLEATLASITPKGDSVAENLPRAPCPAGRHAAVHRHERRCESGDREPRRSIARADDCLFRRRHRLCRRWRPNRQVEVETGLQGITSVEVTGGLEEGAELVSPVPDGLVDGARRSATGS
jgi:membrane fusion protein (multidrug efflux system)